MLEKATVQLIISAEMASNVDLGNPIKNQSSFLMMDFMDILIIQTTQIFNIATILNFTRNKIINT